MKLFHFYLETVSIVSYICIAQQGQKYTKKETKQMKKPIKTTTVRNWKKLLDRGDINTMSNGNQVLRKKISKALNHGIASLETMQLINAFIEKKKTALAEIETNA